MQIKTLAVTCILCLVVIIKGQKDGGYYPSLYSVPDRRIQKVLPSFVRRQKWRNSDNSYWKLKTWIQIRLKAGRLRHCRQRSDRVRDKYRKARWLQKPMLYGFTDAEAANFIQRFDDDDVDDDGLTASCQQQEEGIQRKDVVELYRNFKRTQCRVDDKKRNLKNKSSANKRQKRDVADHRSFKNEENVSRRKRDSNNASNVKNSETVHHHRSSRATTGEPIKNSDGSVTRIRRCLRSNTVTQNGYVRICGVCHAVTMLPPNMYPRYINEVICNPEEKRCLTGGGECTESALKLPFRKDTEGLGPDRLSEWTTYQQPIRSSCNCGIHQDSVFQYFI